MKNSYLLLAIGAVLQLTVHGAPSSPSKGVCNTPHCKEVAGDILKDMNQKADPCIDFNEYTCGGFIERMEIPEGFASYGNLDVIQMRNIGIIKGFVTPGHGPKADSDVAKRNIEKMQNYYAACMDDATLVKLGRRPMVDQIQRFTDIYSVPKSPIQHKKTTATANRHSLSIAIGQALKTGVTAFVKHYISSDIYHPTRNLMYLYPTGLGLPSSQLYNISEITQAYQQIVGEMFYLMYSEEDPVRNHDKEIQVPKVWADVAERVVAFEKKLSAVVALTDAVSEPEQYYKLLSLEEIEKRAPSLDWKLIFRTAFPSDVKLPDKISIGVPEFLDKLDELLSSADPEAVQLYFAWATIKEFGTYLDKEHRQPLENLSKALGDVSGFDHSEKCAWITTGSLPDIVSHYFVEATFPKPAFGQIDEMINTLRTTYSKSFQSYNWLDSFTRKGALNKLKGLLHKVGYSTSGPDDSSLPSLDKFYNDLKLDGKEYFGNKVRKNEFWARDEFRTLYRKVDRMHMDMSAPTVNAYYGANKNDMNMLAGIMQRPFYNVDAPQYLNYGSIGTIAGHEMIHGFDNNGRKWDVDGAYRNWWSNSSIDAFNARTTCLVDQYSNFTVPGPNGTQLQVDGQLTLGENIADNGGIKKSYESWMALYRSDPQGKKYNNQRLPGLEHLTPEQMFFIQFGRLWCNKARPEFAEKQLQNVHSPAQWRIKGVAQNSEYFAKAFKCKAGQPMNPVKKCNVW
ncbi:hypothetical protein B0O80DRAFT_149533 [Mortierella sp. GBAus27b]|nr:hypothetical protein BGX31_005977 [Mortierella sp. GBA43]KAI8361086.1 hypothetical protein B0O80DRAFT_149533 [Mortierella sp. GBAus27b]